MGWDKTYSNKSEINTVIKTLDSSKSKYTIINLKDNKRMLITEEYVYLESQHIDVDCDGHDEIYSKQFDRHKLFHNPINWRVVGYYEYGYYDEDEKKYIEPYYKNCIYINTADYNKYIIPESNKPQQKEEQTEQKIQSNIQNPKQICERYLKRNCKFGDKCKFDHIKSDQPCKFFQSGYCKHEDDCRYSHTITEQPKIKCRFFESGNCKYNDKCKYLHPKSIKTVVCKLCNITLTFGKDNFVECKNDQCQSDYRLDPKTNKIKSTIYKKSYCTAPDGSCGIPCLVQQNSDGTWPESYCGGHICIID